MIECYWCKKPIKDGEPSLLVNMAPNAASGGVSMPHHTACAPFTMQMVPNTNRPPRGDAGQPWQRSPVAEQIFYGYFEGYEEPARPEYDPGLAAPCPFCGKSISVGYVRTHSLMYASPSYAKRSYFYRTHRSCDEAAPTETSMDGFILDMIARNGD